ncbi:MAG: DNA methyltransferase [Roseibium sp.]
MHRFNWFRSSTETAEHNRRPSFASLKAVRDCSKRGEVVLNVFGGSGSTLIAADQCGRQARLIEIDPLYCDTIIRRFESMTVEQAYLAATEIEVAEV